MSGPIYRNAKAAVITVSVFLTDLLEKSVYILKQDSENCVYGRLYLNIYCKAR